VRFVGGSNFSLQQIQGFEQVRRFDGLQPPYHLFRRDIEASILPFCQQHHIGVLAYGPLAHGLLTGRYSPDTTFPADDWRSKSDIFKGEPLKRNLGVVEQLKQIAQRSGCTLPQLATAWVLAQPAVDCAIVGTLTPQEITDTSAAADIHLAPDDMRAIASVMRAAVSVGGPSPEGTFTNEAQPHPMSTPTGSESTDATI
jgi:aryl-alcohol dehydrogenase-like predicted oxidoreductase